MSRPIWVSLSETLASRPCVARASSVGDVAVGGGGCRLARDATDSPRTSTVQRMPCRRAFRGPRARHRVGSPATKRSNHPPRQRKRGSNAAQDARRREAHRNKALDVFAGTWLGWKLAASDRGPRLSPALDLRGDRLGRNDAVERAVRLRIEPATEVDRHAGGRPDDIQAIDAQRRRAVKAQARGVVESPM